MEQIQESIKEKIEKEIKEKEALESAKDIFHQHMTSAMTKRNEEWEQKKKDFVTENMNALKEVILEHARSELQKDKNKEIIAEKARERAARDKKIAAQTVSRPEDVEAEATGKNLDSNDFKRGNFEKTSPSKQSDRPARNADDGFNIQRSDKPRGTQGAQEEEGKRPGGFTRGPPREDGATGFTRGPPRSDAKEGTTGFTRGPPRSEAKEEGTGFGRGPPRAEPKEQADTGFARGNFAKKTAEDGPPKRTAKPAEAGAGASGPGFGFRNSNATRGAKGPAAAKK